MNLHDTLHRLRYEHSIAFVLMVLFLLIVCGIIAAKPLTQTRTRAAVFGTVLVGWTILWWLVDGPVEGRILLRVSYNHGLTMADLLGAPALVLAVVLNAVAHTRASRRPRRLRVSPGGPPKTQPTAE